MLVGSGASLGATGTGAINATNVPLVFNGEGQPVGFVTDPGNGFNQPAGVPSVDVVIPGPVAYHKALIILTVACRAGVAGCYMSYTEKRSEHSVCVPNHFGWLSAGRRELFPGKRHLLSTVLSVRDNNRQGCLSCTWWRRLRHAGLDHGNRVLRDSAAIHVGGKISAFDHPGPPVG
jgi:hypothetical protein